MSRLLKSKKKFGAIKVKLLEKKVSDSRLTRGVPSKTSPNRNPFNRQGEGSELIRKVMMIFISSGVAMKCKECRFRISRNYELCEDSWQLVKNVASNSA